MRKNERIKLIIAVLTREYPTAACSLTHNAPHELLIATRLSAQCTDKRVNAVTPLLFAEFPNIESLANADIARIEEIIKPCGLYKTKAADIKGIAAALLGKDMPEEMDELLRLPGIGRKTANLIRGELFGKPAIVADTHVIRLSYRLGLCDCANNAEKTENALLKIIPPKESLSFCHRLVLHGRAVCKARSPKCGYCALFEWCKKKVDFSRDL